MNGFDIFCFRGLDILQEIQLSSKRQNAFSKIGFERLLDNHLSAKYALMGTLSKSSNFFSPEKYVFTLFLINIGF